MTSDQSNPTPTPHRLKDSSAIGVGLALGVALGAALGNMGVGIALGIVFGVAFASQKRST